MANDNPTNTEKLKNLFTGRPIPEDELLATFKETLQLPALNIYEDPQFQEFLNEELQRLQEQSQSSTTLPTLKHLEKIRDKRMYDRAVMNAERKMRASNPKLFEMYKQKSIHGDKQQGTFTPNPDKDPEVNRFWQKAKDSIERLKKGTFKSTDEKHTQLKQSYKNVVLDFKEKSYPEKFIYYEPYVPNHPILKNSEEVESKKWTEIDQENNSYPIFNPYDLIQDLVQKTVNKTFNLSRDRISPNRTPGISQRTVPTSLRQKISPQFYSDNIRKSIREKARRRATSTLGRFPRLGRLGRGIRAASNLARVAPLAASPWFWIIIAIIILLLLFIFILSGGGGRFDYDEYFASEPPPSIAPGDGQTPENPIPGLHLEKTGPTVVANGEDITYTITARYNGTSDVTVYDKIPTNTQYLDATGTKVVDNTNGIVSWRLNENTPVQGSEAEALDVFRFTLKVRPKENDIIVENSSYATAPGVTTGPAPETNDFETLMKGQGRNVGILGSEDDFISTLFTNSGYRLESRGGRSVYEPYFRQLYRVAVENKINPAIVYTIWGVEQSHNLVDGWEFGCLDETMQGFEKQVQCSVNTLNTHMNRFEEIKARDGLPVPYTVHETCNYTDAFVYAYEVYTPVCTMDHGNDKARGNFIIYYKELVFGVKS